MNSLVGSVFVCLAEKNQKQKTIHHYVIDIYICIYTHTSPWDPCMTCMENLSTFSCFCWSMNANIPPMDPRGYN